MCCFPKSACFTLPLTLHITPISISWIHLIVAPLSWSRAVSGSLPPPHTFGDPKRQHQQEKYLHRRAFTQRSFHAQKEAFTRAEVFTQSGFYTQKLLHTNAFTQRSLCTEAPLHEVTS